MGKYFTIAELVRSETADRRGIDNKLPKKYLPNAQRLIERVLDPLREAYGKPIRVNSGYRCEELNRAVGGSANSAHMKGCAADITAGSAAENKRLFFLAQSIGIEFDQLIDERGLSWVHIGIANDGNNRGMVMKM